MVVILIIINNIFDPVIDNIQYIYKIRTKINTLTYNTQRNFASEYNLED